MYQEDDAMKYYVSKANTMLAKFDGDNATLNNWMKKFESIVDYLGIPDSKKVTFLCSMLDTELFRTLAKDLCPYNIYNVPYLDLIYELNTLNISTNRKLTRQQFRDKIQRNEETVEDYAKNLFQLFSHTFSKEYANIFLCEQFLKGLRDRVIANYLSRKKNVTFKMIATKAIELERRYYASTCG